jgi:hypothetical protein
MPRKIAAKLPMRWRVIGWTGLRPLGAALGYAYRAQIAL